jgi:cytoskeleton protein RodZ
MSAVPKSDKNHEAKTDSNTVFGSASSQATSNPTVGGSSGFVATAVSVADQLRMARVNRSLTIDEVAVRLNLRPASIEAMESGAYEKLPGAAYVAGFVHSYARLLMLDGAALVSQLKVESAVMQPKPVHEMPFKVSQRAFPSAGFIWTGLILLLGLLLLWTLTNNKFAPEMSTTELSDPQALPADVPMDAAEGDEVEAPATTGSATAGSAPSAAPVAAAPAPVASTPAPTAVAPVAAGTTTPATPPVAPAPVAPAAVAPAAGTPDASKATAPSASTAAIPSAAAPSPSTAAPSTPAGATIMAKQNSWIQLRDAKGAVVVAKLLRAGESFPLPNTPGLMMTTGNAGGTFITVNGQPSAPLGQENQVVREIPLDAAPLADYLAKLPSSPNQ